MKQETCCRCQTIFYMSDDIYSVAVKQAEKFSFYCPLGHGQHYASGETEADKLRRENQRLKQNAAYQEDRIREEREAKEAAQRRAAAARGQVTKIKHRAANGVCPCCNRTFVNLARHMSTKHPQWEKEDEVA